MSFQNLMFVFLKNKSQRLLFGLKLAVPLVLRWFGDWGFTFLWSFWFDFPACGVSMGTECSSLFFSGITGDFFCMLSDVGISEILTKGSGRSPASSS